MIVEAGEVDEYIVGYICETCLAAYEACLAKMGSPISISTIGFKIERR